jgi:hypothetical protein
MPIQRPIKFEMIVNPKTAKPFGFDDLVALPSEPMRSSNNAPFLLHLLAAASVQVFGRRH